MVEHHVCGPKSPISFTGIFRKGWERPLSGTLEGCSCVDNSARGSPKVLHNSLWKLQVPGPDAYSLCLQSRLLLWEVLLLLNPCYATGRTHLFAIFKTSADYQLIVNICILLCNNKSLQSGLYNKTLKKQVPVLKDFRISKKPKKYWER